ncbi:SlyX family protein [Parvibaculum lavamentivorans DS-1]|uniref:Protein SlyX homolog n=1 Tax=Parvibaculum lavamentivorans (strain DS-1 / DSM 13023 / NCIMB 13966) TaxID=402881 RepID=A7HV74_PARL1|nr:SlyX family protein [Parvibaculum lavamentivorans]ABS63807.1 SlyX family protein [Parvibaculum lavamentivorans DS-1]
MTAQDAHAARIDELEVRLIHQDKAIEDLNDVITRQWHAIDELKRRLEAMVGRMQAMEEGAHASTTDEPPPPHY